MNVTELCPWCEEEINLEWDIRRLGYQAYCPVCGGRLMQFADALRENYSGFNREMSLTDTYKNRTASNLDAALIRAVRDLRHDGIDYRKILDCGNVLIIVEKDGKKFSVDDCVDKMLEQEKNGWKRSANGSE